MADLMHELFLPYTVGELRAHFVDSDVESEDPERHLKRWRLRIADAPSKDPSFLHRDETLWTAGALMAIQCQGDASNRWKQILSRLFGPVPPTAERLEWNDLLAPDLQLFFEVGLSSPQAYRAWLSHHLDDRQALVTQRVTAAARGESLEGRTHLDALLMSATTGFALHFEAKVLADIDAKTTHDSLRNQLARNIDCMAATAGNHPRPGPPRPGAQLPRSADAGALPAQLA